MKNRIIIITLLCGIQAVNAQVVFESLQDVFEYADKHAFTIHSSKVQQQVAESQRLQAQSFLLPTVTLSTGYTDNISLQSTLVPATLFNPSASNNDFEEMTFGKQHIYNAGVQAQWDILNFQKMFAAKTANRNAIAGEANTEKAKYNIYNQIASTYYSILLTQKTIEIYAENMTATATILDKAQEKYTKGIISEEDLNRVAIQHLQNEKNLECVKTTLKQLLYQLQSQIGTSEELSVSGNIESQIISSTEIINANPEVSWQETLVKSSEAKLKQSKAMHLPSLSLQYQYNYNWATNYFMGFSSANKLPSQYLNLRLSIPVFTGFYTRGKVKESKAEFQLQQRQLDNLRLVKQKEDETIRLQFVQSMSSLDKLKEILELQEINDRHSNNKYESGIISLDARMDKYEKLLSAQYNYLQGLVDYSIAQYKIYIRQINFNTQQ